MKKKLGNHAVPSPKQYLSGTEGEVVFEEAELSVVLLQLLDARLGSFRGTGVDTEKVQRVPLHVHARVRGGPVRLRLLLLCSSTEVKRGALRALMVMSSGNGSRGGHAQEVGHEGGLEIQGCATTDGSATADDGNVALDGERQEG